MDSSKIHRIISKDDILNKPGVFYFKNKEDRLKSKSRQNIDSNEINKITKNISNVFQTITNTLSQKIMYSLPENSDVNYTPLMKKLEGFTKSSEFQFPGLQVINFTKNLVQLCSKFSERVLICEKSDGVRYLMIVFKNKRVLFLNRKEEFYLVDLVMELPFVNSTGKDEWEIQYFFDGELILDKVDADINNFKPMIYKNIIKIKNADNEYELYKLNFLIFDAIVISNVNIGAYPFGERIKMLNDFNQQLEHQRFTKLIAKEALSCKLNEFYNFKTKTNIEENSSNPFYNNLKTLLNHNIEKNGNEYNKYTSNIPNLTSIDLFVKNYYTFDKMYDLYSQKSMFLHENDGIIINYDDYPYYIGQSSEIFKWKPAHLNTIDFEVTLQEDTFILNVCEGREKIVPVSILFFKDNEEKSKFLEDYNKQKIQFGNVIVECFYDKSKNTHESDFFNFLKETQDKLMNNDGFTLNLQYYYDYVKNKDSLSKGNFVDHYKSGCWSFLRIRNDKNYGNHKRTYVSIVFSIKEDLTIDYIKEIIEQEQKEKNSNKMNLEKHFQEMSKIFLTGNPAFLAEDVSKSNNRQELFSKLENNKEESNDNSFLGKKRENTSNNISNILNKYKNNDYKDEYLLSTLGKLD